MSVSWPFRCSIRLALRDGKVSLPPGHPDFDARHEAVGQLPVSNPADPKLQTIMVIGLGAVAEPRL